MLSSEKSEKGRVYRIADTKAKITHAEKQA
jgi:hypothetical protein